jgi:DNA-binding NarL/FixJ family response regulator
MFHNKPVHVALVEDHQGTREALEAELRRAVSQVASVVAVQDGETCLALPRLRSIDVALVDLRLPGISGAETIRRLASVAPQVRAIALTVFDDGPTVLEAIGAGAVGYLVKSEPSERLLLAISEAAANQHPISSRVAGYLLTQLRVPAASPLTERELELASILAEGASYAEAAASLGIAIGTVQAHVKSIYRKLDVNSKSEVRTWLQRHAPKS